MDEGSSKLTVLFFTAAVAMVLLLRFVVPLVANGTFGLGIEIPRWALRLSPANPLRAIAFAAGGALGIVAAIAVLLRRVLHSK